jgi:hypothetical protein
MDSIKVLRCVNSPSAWTVINVEATSEIVLVHLLESLEYLRHSSVREVVDSCETYLATKCQEERNLFQEKYVSCQKNLFVEFQLLLRNLHKVPGHRMRLAPSGFAFQRGDVLSPNLHSNTIVLDSYWEFLDLVSATHLLEVLHGWVTQGLVQSLC